MKKNYRVLISLCLFLLVLISGAGCKQKPSPIPPDFIGVTKIEVVDYLNNPNHQFRFLLFTTLTTVPIDSFKDQYLENIVINRLPDIYLKADEYKVIGSAYEIIIDVKTVVCSFTTVKIAFDQAIKDINFGHYQQIDSRHNTTQIDVFLNYDLKPNDNIYNMQLLIHNYRASNIYLEEIMLPVLKAEQREIKPLTDNLIISDNIKAFSNINLTVPRSLYYVKGLINLRFTTDFLSLDHTTTYLIDNLPDYYYLKSKGIEISTLLTHY